LFLAVKQIEKLAGVVVTYEDTLYVHPDDLVDVTAQRFPKGNAPRRILEMRRGSIDVTYTPRPGPIETQVGELLRLVLDDSRRAGNTGQFRMEEVPVWRTLEASNPRLSWALLCEEGEDGVCALNINGVPMKK
jgi:hypothetical protein